jgi:hypothetical protein
VPQICVLRTVRVWSVNRPCITFLTVHSNANLAVTFKCGPHKLGLWTVPNAHNWWECPMTASLVEGMYIC